MQTDWLIQQGKKSCIMFFNGWGMDPNPFKDIPLQKHDLFMVYDYSKLTKFDLRNLSGSYEQLHLVAWSMGVWAAPFIVGDHCEKFTTITAINGTLTPVDDNNGISSSVYRDMINTFSSRTLHDFYAAMFTNSKGKDLFFENRPVRAEKNILRELDQLWKLYKTHGPANNIFNKKIVGSRDRIFPARNQVRCWGKNQCSIIKAPHFPFYEWSSWDKIILL